MSQLFILYNCGALFTYIRVLICTYVSEEISPFEKRKSYFQDSQRKLERDYSTDCERKTNPRSKPSDSHKVSVEVGSEFENYDEVKAEGYARYGVAEVK